MVIQGKLTRVMLLSISLGVCVCVCRVCVCVCAQPAASPGPSGLQKPRVFLSH